MRETQSEGELEGGRWIPESVKQLSCLLCLFYTPSVSKVIYPTKATDSKTPERQKEPRKSQIDCGQEYQADPLEGLRVWGSGRAQISPPQLRGCLPRVWGSSPSGSAPFSGVPERWPDGQMSAWGQGCQKGWEVTGRSDPPGCLLLVGSWGSAWQTEECCSLCYVALQRNCGRQLSWHTGSFDLAQGSGAFTDTAWDAGTPR